MITWLLTPLSYGFMQRGFAAAVLVGIVCSVLGTYVVLKSMAFLGDALAHAVLPGIAVAYLLGANLTVGALIAAVAVSLGIGLLAREGAVKEDTAIGILFAAALSLGVALISSIRTYAVDLSHILFGNLLGVSSSDLLVTLVLSLSVIIIIILLYRPLMVVSFDPVLASVLKLPINFLRTTLLILLAITIVISIQTVGVGLVSAMLVTPAAAAYLLTRRLSHMMFSSVIIGVLSSISGLYLSFYLNIASGAAIVLTATFVFLVAFFFSPIKGIFRPRVAQE